MIMKDGPGYVKYTPFQKFKEGFPVSQFPSVAIFPRSAPFE